MKILLDFSDGAVSIPAPAFRRLRRASDTALRFLMILASDASVRENYETEADRVAALLGCDRARLDAALSFWCGAGVADKAEDAAVTPSGTSEPTASTESTAQTSPSAATPDGVGNSPELSPQTGGQAGAGAEKGAPATGTDTGINTVTDAVTGTGADSDAAASSDKNRGSAQAEGGSQSQSRPVRKTKLQRAAEIPDYSAEELGHMLESDVGAMALVDEGQRRIGRMFNTREVAILVGLKNYLELSNEFLYILLEHCAHVGKTSMRYVETTAFGIYDEGIHDADALRQKLADRELYSGFEGRFKAMVGARGRRLSAKESRFINRWCLEMKYDFEMVELAYDLTVDRCHEYNPAYMNGILERWYADGITTPDAVRSDAEAHNGTQKKTPRDGVSFNTDEFFEAALRRSYSDN